jgi:hypothetical protein
VLCDLGKRKCANDAGAPQPGFGATSAVLPFDALHYAPTFQQHVVLLTWMDHKRTAGRDSLSVRLGPEMNSGVY